MSTAARDGSSALGSVGSGGGAFGLDFSSPFVPVGVTPRYPAPRANIKPADGAPGCGACSPSRSPTSGSSSLSLVASFVGLAVQVLIPNEVGQAIDSARTTAGTLTHVRRHRSSCWRCCASSSTTRRASTCSKTAYRIEYDLRNIMYEHLSRMSFSFYDRVQSGQLISRGNSDIRSGADVPRDGADRVRAMQCRGPRVRIDAHDQRAAGVRCDVDDAIRLHRGRAHAALHVPGVVADPVAPRRRRHRGRREHQRRARGEVVRRRGAPAPASSRLRRSAPSGRT